MNQKRDIVLDILAAQLNLPRESIHPARTITDLGGDSLDVVEVVMTLEEQFNVEIPFSDQDHIVSVEKIVKYLDKKEGKKKTWIFF